MIPDVVSELGAGWTYERHLPGGGAGVALVRRPDGSPAVLRVGGGTLSQQQERVSHIRSLRAAGYATPHEDEPRELASGALACITDFVADAEPVEALTDGLVDELCGLLDLPSRTGAERDGVGQLARPVADRRVRRLVSTRRVTQRPAMCRPG